MKKQQKTKRSYRLPLIVASIVILALGGFLIVKRIQSNNDANQPEDKTTSTAPSAQGDFNTGDDRSVAESPDKGSASVSDTKGQQTAVPDKSQWSTSPTGEITVYSPAKNQLLVNGASVSGESTLPVVYFRVIDDVSGMISQGQLSVVGGKYSGTVNFTTTATNGRFDIYGATDSGKEYGNVEIPIRFK